jgi:hypothetical protein
MVTIQEWRIKPLYKDSCRWEGDEYPSKHASENCMRNTKEVIGLIKRPITTEF